jgi:murein DD-endopeptidase MepM/ murein hydrolase activator NlpD
MRYLSYMKIKLREHQVNKLFNKLNEDGSYAKVSPEFEKFAKYFEESADDGFILKQPNQPGGPNDTQPKDKEEDVWLHPLGVKSKILTDFGPIKGKNTNHNGLDFEAPSGSQVFSPSEGTVLSAKDTTPNSCGGYVLIDHETLHTKYCHLKKWVVRKGDKVKKGQLIGYTGGGKDDPYRGTSTVPHLHYETLTPAGISIRPDHISSK